MEFQDKKSQNKKTKNLKAYARYSGLAFEMMAVISAGVFGGIKLDEIIRTKPVFTIILSLISVVAAMYFVIKGTSSKS